MSGTDLSQGKNRKAAVLLIAGEGGHLEQARRLQSTFAPDVLQNASSVLLTDHEREADADFEHIYSLPTPAPKHREPKVKDRIDYTVALVKFIFQLRKTYDVRTVIVTGPGFALFPALVYRIAGAKLIVFESWSRFEDKSKCGRALYPFAHHFLVQHKELLKIYPKAVWTGLL